MINFFSSNLIKVHPRDIHAKLKWNPMNYFTEEDFLSLLKSHSGNKPRQQQPCFLPDQNFFKESRIGPPKEHSCQIIMKSIEPFWRRFLKFYDTSYSENNPRPRQPCFLSDQNFFKESKRGQPMEHSGQIILKSIEPFNRRRFFKFTIYHIVETSPVHGRAFFPEIGKRA